MPEETKPASANRDLATLPFAEAVEAYSPNFAAVLPSHIPLERFKRCVVTAVNLNPDLRYADRRTLFNACVKCATDGLYPDGREAALVIYKTKVKTDAGEQWIDAVQYLPMIAGIRKRMRNTGEVLSATAEVVYRNDKFHFLKGEDPRIEHEPPPLDQERGDPVGAYAIIKLANGETLREVMARSEIEKARAVSRSGQTKGAPWMVWWDEMARKTVLRRCAKAAPTGSDLDHLLSRDDEAPDLPALADMTETPARPRREDFADAPAEGGLPHPGITETADSEDEPASPGSSPPPVEAQERAEWRLNPPGQPHRPLPARPSAPPAERVFGGSGGGGPDSGLAELLPDGSIRRIEPTAPPAQAAAEVGTAAPAVASPAAPDPDARDELPLEQRQQAGVYRRR